MTTQRSHVCSACKGDGREYDRCSNRRSGLYGRCPVCLGAGSIWDQMPARDAIADAETLRDFMRDGRHFCDLGTCEGWYLGFMDLGGGTRKHLRRRWYERAALSAMGAAHAAFRAVPGLRGEE